MYAVNKNRMRRPFNPNEDASFKAALQFMRDAGRTGYDFEITLLQETFEEMQSDAGPGGPDCPATQDMLDKINEEIEAVAQSAYDRVQDWATD